MSNFSLETLNVCITWLASLDVYREIKIQSEQYSVLVLSQEDRQGMGA